MASVSMTGPTRDQLESRLLGYSIDKFLSYYNCTMIPLRESFWKRRLIKDFFITGNSKCHNEFIWNCHLKMKDQSIEKVCEYIIEQAIEREWNDFIGPFLISLFDLADNNLIQNDLMTNLLKRSLEITIEKRKQTMLNIVNEYVTLYYHTYLKMINFDITTKLIKTLAQRHNKMDLIELFKTNGASTETTSIESIMTTSIGSTVTATKPTSPSLLN
jgi:phosphoribosyl-ATP pyrophosphohydrolase